MTKRGKVCDGHSRAMHKEFYRENQRYAETLRDVDPRTFQSLPQVSTGRPFHEKYIHALAAGRRPGDLILDVGCGAGQAVRALARMNFSARGVDVSETSLALARSHVGDYRLFDGLTLPFADRACSAVGACNVLEHVEKPLAFLDEMTRVLAPSGRLVISSPNFLRLVGWRDYHPHMRGLAQKWRNLQIVRRHATTYARDNSSVLFETLTPILREPPRPDDDAVTATSAIDLSRYFETRAFRDIHVSCVDRPLPHWMEALLDATPLRFHLLNCFVSGTKTS